MRVTIRVEIVISDHKKLEEVLKHIVTIPDTEVDKIYLNGVWYGDDLASMFKAEAKGVED